MPEKLDPAQQRAVEEKGAVIILAGPGSGKTRVITEKVLHLIKTSVKPENILALTFSNKAAKEMSDRLEKKMDISDLKVSTFHSFCLEVLEDNVLDSGISFSSGIVSRTNQLVWGVKNLDSFGFEHIEVGNNAAEVIESVIDGISAFRDELISPEELETYLVKKDKEKLPDEERVFVNQLKDLLKVYKAYEKYKRKEMLLDFDDMIHEASDLLGKKPLVLKQYKDRYRYILVDEFQDTNYAQLYLLKQLAGDNICVVGDDDQSIYRFRGAYLTNFRDFKEHFKKHKQIILDHNYRNSKNILGLAMQLMKNAPNREEKPLVTKNEAGDKIVAAKCESEEAEAEFVLDEIKKLVGKKFFSRAEQKERPLAYKDIAILSRRRMEGVKYDQILKKNGMPCEFVGEVEFFSTPVIRDLISYLTIIDSPAWAGINLNRIMKISGIDEINVQRINEHAKKKAWNDKTSDFVFECMQEADKLLGSQKEHVLEIVDTLNKLFVLKEKTTVSELVYQVMINYTDLYKNSLQDTVEEQKNRLLLNKFYEITKDYESISKGLHLHDFLEYVDMLKGFEIELEETEDRDSVKIMTVHQSKGREFPVVFIVDLATNRFPLRYQSKPFYVPNDLSKGLKTTEKEQELFTQEERRLFYVAMTRAEQKLFLVLAERYGDNVNPTKPSKFLKDDKKEDKSIKYDSNPLVDVVSVAQKAEKSIIGAQSRIEMAKHELQKQAAKAVNQMQLKAALQKMLELEKIKFIEKTGKLDGFDKKDFFSVEEDDKKITLLFEGKRMPIVKKEQHFSASSLGNYDECPLKYKFGYVLNVPMFSTPAADLGGVVHKVMEEMTKREKEGKKPDKKTALEMLGKFWDSSSYQSKKKEEEDKKQAEKLIDTYLEWQKTNKNEVVNVEMEFSFKLGERTVKGRIDRIEKTRDGEYLVIDYKTGYPKMNSKSIIEDLQINLYCLAILSKYGKLPQKASLFYIKPNKMVDYLPTKESVEKQRKRFEQLIEGVFKEQFEATPSYDACKWCNFTDLCDEKEVEE